MKAMGSAITRKIASVAAAVSALFVGGVTQAWARPIDEPEIGGHFSGVPSLPAQSAGGGKGWLIGLIVAVGVLALAAGLAGTVRLVRSRGNHMPVEA